MSSIGSLTSTQIATNCDNMFSSGTNTDAQVEYITNLAVSRGLENATDGDYEAAITEYKTAISLAPYSDNSLTAYGYMATAYEKLGNTSAAIKAYKQASGFFPTEDSLHSSLGLIYFNQGDYESADTEYSKAVELDPNVAESVYSLGQVYLAEGLYTDAETQFKKSKLISPDDPSGYYALGQTYRKMGQYDDAAIQLKSAIAMDSSYSEAYLELGKTYADMKQTDNAEAQLDILSGFDDDTSKSMYTELSNYLASAAAPKITMAYSSNGFITTSGSGTLVSDLYSDLSSSSSSRTFTMNFAFNKDMDASSVQNIANWRISRASGSEPGGAYNWGLAVKDSELSISPIPLSVKYSADKLTAQVTFRITQNSEGNGTLDPSHIMFKFSGVDTNGTAMNLSADQFSGISKIV